MAAPMALLSRFKGSVVGGVVGDCIGAVFEGCWGSFIGVEQVLKEVEKINKVAEKLKSSHTDSPDKTSKNVWEFTDDTAMARSVAKSLIANHGLLVNDVAKRFSDEFIKEPGRGYGGGVVSVFRQLAESNCEDVFGPSRRQFDGQGSYGNGGAMRISPAALFAHRKEMNFKQLHDLVHNITLITHSHPGALLGSVLQCYAVHLALRTENLDVNSFIDGVLDKLSPLEEKMTSGSADKTEEEGNTESSDKATLVKPKTYTSKLETIRELATREKQPSDDEIDDVLGTDIAAFESAPTALYCFLRAKKDIEGIDKSFNPFERTIIYAISLGGDTDTIATMAGAIAGAYYGIESVPWTWQRCCEGVNDALRDAESLFNLT